MYVLAHSGVSEQFNPSSFFWLCCVFFPSALMCHGAVYRFPPPCAVVISATFVQPIIRDTNELPLDSRERNYGISPGVDVSQPLYQPLPYIQNVMLPTRYRQNGRRWNCGIQPV
jgi:hypothetical protein